MTGGVHIGLFYTNIALDILLLAVPIVYILQVEKKALSLRELGLGHMDAVKAVALAGKITTALLAASFILSLALSTLSVNDTQKVGAAMEKAATFSPLLLLYFAAVRVFAEEFFFRAFLVPRIGAAGSSILFGLSHIAYGSVAEVIGAIVLGYVLAVFYRDNRALLPNYVAHVLYNFVVLTAVFSG